MKGRIIRVDTLQDKTTVLQSLRNEFPNMGGLLFVNLDTIMKKSQLIKKLYGLEFMINAELLENYSYRPHIDDAYIVYGHCICNMYVHCDMDRHLIDTANSVKIDAPYKLSFRINRLEVETEHTFFDLDGYNAKHIVLNGHNFKVNNPKSKIELRSGNIFGNCDTLRISCDSDSVYWKRNMAIAVDVQFNEIEIYYSLNPFNF